MPRLSIITVCFNAEDGIKATLDSVAALRFRDFEYIIVDGASRDGTLAIIKQYGPLVSRLVSEPDKGIYDAMNKAIGLAQGEFIWFLNAKDTIEDPGFLDGMDWGHDFYYGGVVFRNGDQEVKRSMPRERLTRYTSLLGQVCCHQSMMIRKSVSPIYDLRYRIVADFDWSIRILKTPGLKVRRIERYWVNYELDGFSGRNFHRCWKENISILASHYGPMARPWAYLLFFWFQFKRTAKSLLGPIRDAARKR